MLSSEPSLEAPIEPNAEISKVSAPLNTFLVNNDMSRTVYNGVAPNPVRNSEFTNSLCKVLKRPGVLNAPAVFFKLALGEQSMILLGSQNVIPKNFTDTKFIFKFNNLKEALLDLLKYQIKGEEFFTRSIWLDKIPSETFNFFSDEKNLEKITPKHLNFKVVGTSTPSIREGTFIDYKLSLHGIPFKWKTLIKSYIPNEVFIDEQIKGPYSKWHQKEFHYSFQQIFGIVNRRLSFEFLV